MTDASTQERHTTLFYQEGSSDKEYRLHLVPKDGGWVVDYQYGKRGKALRAGSKTAAPVDFETAVACYDKVLNGQLKDGYTPTEGGVAFQDTEREKRFTGIVPQLLNPIDDTDATHWLADDEAVAQEKHDGERRLLNANAGVITGINRSGLAVALPKPVEAACQAITAQAWVADGEDMGGHIVLFDLLEVDGIDLRSRSVKERLQRLEALIPANDVLRVVETAYTQEEKHALVARVRAQNGEGVVFKKGDAPYVPGRPASGGNQVKLKFVESATVRVCGGRATKRSVGIEAKNTDGAWVKVGNVSVPANHEVPEPGTVVEVGYLYAYRGGSLFQPTYKGPRTDLTEEACALTQLKYKKGADDEAAPAVETEAPKPKSKRKMAA